MAKDDRLYAKFDINMDENAKIILLSDAAFRALIESTMYCRRQLTDGFLADRVVTKKWGADIASELSSNHHDRPSWVRVEGGWQVWDFAEHQTTNADIETKRAAGKMGGEARAKRFAEAKAKHEASKPVAPATEVLKQKASITLAKTETETETETETGSKDLSAYGARSADVTAAFNAAYAHWPKKTERKVALERFKVAAKSIGLEDLAAHVTRFGDAYAATTARQFTPALGVWLGRERWTDELPTADQPDRKPTRGDNNLAYVQGLYNNEQQQAQWEIEA